MLLRVLNFKIFLNYGEGFLWYQTKILAFGCILIN